MFCKDGCMDIEHNILLSLTLNRHAFSGFSAREGSVYDRSSAAAVLKSGCI